MPSPITFIVPGEEQAAPTARTRGAGPAPAPSTLPQGQVRQSVRVGTQRGGGGEVRMSAVPGQDMVVLEIADGPTLTLHPESARDLMLAQGKARKRSGTNGKPAPLPGETEVPVELRWEGLEEGVVARGATRGFLGRVLLKAVHLVTGDRAVDATVEKVVERVDAQVVHGVVAVRHGREHRAEQDARGAERDDVVEPPDQATEAVDCGVAEAGAVYAAIVAPLRRGGKAIGTIVALRDGADVP